LRPIYESATDRAKERAVIDCISAQFNLRAEKLPKFDIDFALLRGKEVVMVTEVKCRNAHYDQMFISLDKCRVLRDYAATGLQARVIFATPEGVYAKIVGPLHIDGWIGIGGRKDRNDGMDQEMVVYFDTDEAKSKELWPMKRLMDSKQEWFR